MTAVIRTPSVAAEGIGWFGRWRPLLAVAGVSLLALLPAIVGPRLIDTATRALIAVLFATGFNLLWRHCRLLSFGHAVYFGAGSFATIHLMQSVERGSLALPLPLLPFAGMVASGLLGAACGALSTVRKGTYFAMITLALAELAHSLGPQWQSLFGGEAGISSMRAPWAGISFGTVGEVYFLVLAWSAAGLGLLWLFGMTPLGRAAFALGENEERLRFLGLSTRRIKTTVFVVSAMASGAAGSLLALTDETVNYTVFSSAVSIAPVMHSFIGGAGFFLGPAFGAILLTFFSSVVGEATRLWLLYQGVAFVAVVLFLPQGLAGLLRESPSSVLRKGWSRTIAVWIVTFAGLLLLATSVVFCSETLATVLSDSYAAARAASGQRFPAIERFGFTYLPASPTLWVLCLSAFGLGSLLLKRGGATWGRR